MFTWSEYTQFVVSVFFLALTPGPSMIPVMSQSVRGNSLHAASAVLGITTANIILILVTAIIKLLLIHLSFKIGLLFHIEFPTVYLKIAGSCALIAIAFRIIIRASHRPKYISIKADDDIVLGTPSGVFWMSAWIHCANPATIFFYTSIFLSLVDGTDQYWFKIFVLGFIPVLLDLLMLGLLATFTAAISLVTTLNKSLARMPILAGALLAILGMQQLLEATEVLLG